MNEFKNLVSENLAFVNDWISKKITSLTYRLYGKKISAKEVGNKLVQHVQKYTHSNNLREIKSKDIDKSRYSRRNCGTISIITVN